MAAFLAPLLASAASGAAGSISAPKPPAVATSQTGSTSVGGLSINKGITGWQITAIAGFAVLAAILVLRK